VGCSDSSDHFGAWRDSGIAEMVVGDQADEVARGNVSALKVDDAEAVAIAVVGEANVQVVGSDEVHERPEPLLRRVGEPTAEGGAGCVVDGSHVAPGGS